MLILKTTLQNTLRIEDRRSHSHLLLIRVLLYSRHYATEMRILGGGGLKGATRGDPE
jgi:hypothetical protein